MQLERAEERSQTGEQTDGEMHRRRQLTAAGARSGATRRGQTENAIQTYPLGELARNREISGASVFASQGESPVTPNFFTATYLRLLHFRSFVFGFDRLLFCCTVLASLSHSSL